MVILVAALCTLVGAGLVIYFLRWIGRTLDDIDSIVAAAFLLFAASFALADERTEAKARAAWAYAASPKIVAVKDDPKPPMKAAKPVKEVAEKTEIKRLSTVLTFVVGDPQAKLYLDGELQDSFVVEVPAMPPGPLNYAYRYRVKVVYGDGREKEWWVRFKAGEDAMVELKGPARAVQYQQPVYYQPQYFQSYGRSGGC